MGGEAVLSFQGQEATVPRYRVWWPEYGYEEEDSRPVEADSPRRAAEDWCESRDARCVEYPAHREVMVREDRPGAEAEAYEVEVAPVPVYVASKKK